MKAAFVIFDRMTSLDFIGFYDPVTRLKSMKIMDDFEWRTCSTAQNVVDDRGLRIEANRVAEPLDSYDMVFLPGGFGTRTLQNDRAFVDWLKTAASCRNWQARRPAHESLPKWTIRTDGIRDSHAI